MVLFILSDDPRTFYTYAAMTLFVLGTVFENTTVDGLFNKNLPKDIRGTLNGAYNFFGNVGILIFSKIGGYLYDSAGPNSPFIFLGICDIAFALLIVGLKLTNKIKDWGLLHLLIWKFYLHFW